MGILILFATGIYILVGLIEYRNCSLTYCDKEIGKTIYTSEEKGLTHQFVYNVQVVENNGYVEKIFINMNTKKYLSLKAEVVQVFHDYEFICIDSFQSYLYINRFMQDTQKIDYSVLAMASKDDTGWYIDRSLLNPSVSTTTAEFFTVGRITADQIADSLKEDGQLFRIVIS